MDANSLANYVRVLGSMQLNRRRAADSLCELLTPADGHSASCFSMACGSHFAVQLIVSGCFLQFVTDVHLEFEESEPRRQAKALSGPHKAFFQFVSGRLRVRCVVARGAELVDRKCFVTLCGSTFGSDQLQAQPWHGSQEDSDCLSPLLDIATVRWMIEAAADVPSAGNRSLLFKPDDDFNRTPSEEKTHRSRLASEKHRKLLGQIRAPGIIYKCSTVIWPEDAVIASNCPELEPQIAVRLTRVVELLHKITIRLFERLTAAIIARRQETVQTAELDECWDRSLADRCLLDGLQQSANGCFEMGWLAIVEILCRQSGVLSRVEFGGFEVDNRPLEPALDLYLAAYMLLLSARETPSLPASEVQQIGVAIDRAESEG